MKKEFQIFLGIFLCLAASRFIPHPWNFTSLLALSFYIPAIVGFKYIAFLIISFAITDLFIGFHSLILWTWGSVLLIGFLPIYFNSSISLRIPGALTGAIIFFLVTNFGVWLLGYPKTIEGFVNCFLLAIPFYIYTLLGDLFYTYFLIYSHKFILSNFVLESK